MALSLSRGGEIQPDAHAGALPEGVDRRDPIAHYCAAVTCTDDLIGELLARLEANGIADNTIIALSPDYGELPGSHCTFNKDRVYGEAIRVPMISRFPSGFGPAAHASQVASNVDVAQSSLRRAALPEEGREIPPSHSPGLLAIAEVYVINHQYAPQSTRRPNRSNRIACHLEPCA